MYGVILYCNKEQHVHFFKISYHKVSLSSIINLLCNHIATNKDSNAHSRLERLHSIAEDWVFESRLRQTKVVKAASVSSTSKRSPSGISVTGPRR